MFRSQAKNFAIGAGETVLLGSGGTAMGHPPEQEAAIKSRRFSTRLDVLSIITERVLGINALREQYTEEFFGEKAAFLDCSVQCIWECK